MEIDHKKNEGQKHKFSADRPITSREEDLLRRSAFADSLAAAIKGWKGKDSLVIALYGPWGSGKSSIKNMVLQTLHAVKAEAPLIAEFNPWQWAGQDRLAEAFFGEIELVLGKPGMDKADKKCAAKWKTYAATWKAGSFIAGGFRKLVLILVTFVAATGFLNGLLDSYWLRGIWISISLLAVVFLMLETLYGFIGTFSEKVASVFEARLKANSQTLAEQKKELSALLRELKTPILVVIDDVDRLLADEIRLLFQLIKANADFPNVVYLLLFQRDIVERSLDSPGIKGQEFLGKIVQVGFDIPRIEQTRLEKVLFERLDELLADEQISKHFDKNHWENLLFGGIRPYFRTLRDVHRYLATLSFHVSLFRSAGSFEVNLVDLIALEVLRVFEPGVYKRIPETKEELTRLRDSAQESHDENERTRRLVESIVAGASQQDQVREIVKQLFPAVEWIWGVWYGHGPLEELFRDLRVCHPKVFDRYFHFTIPEGDISQAQLDRILSLAGNREGLVAELRALNKQGLLGVALDRLEAYKEKIDIGHAVSFVSALFDIGDELPEEQGGFFSISPETHASRIIYWYLKQEKDPGKRGQILKESIKASTGLYMPIRTVSLEGRKQKRDENPEALNVTDADLRELQQLCIEKIMQAVGSGKLATHPNMAAILYRWREWDSPEKPEEWVKKLIDSSQGTLSFLIACLQKTTTQGLRDHISQEHREINLTNVEDFVSVEALEEKVRLLSLDNFGDKEKKAVEAFQKAVKRRREGKPDSTGWPDDEEAN